MEQNRFFSGIRVLDAGSWIAGPAAATIMADFGAEVIKVEQPGSGEVYRGYSFNNADAKAKNVDYTYIIDSHSKKSLSLNLKSPKGYAVFEELVKISDVVLTNQPLDARKRLRLDYESVKAINPRVIYASMTPLGEEGAEASKKLFDRTSYWPRSGLMDLMRPKGTTPKRYYVPGQGDHAVAVSLFAGIMMGLWERERTGKGCKVATSLLHNGLWANGLSVQAGLCGLDFPSPVWNYDVLDAFWKPIYQSKDGRYIMLDTVRTPAERDNMLKALGLFEKVTSDERFKTEEGYKEHALYLIDLIDEKISGMTLEELEAKCDEYDAPMVWIRTVYDIEHDKQVLANDMLIPVEGEEWHCRYVLNNPVQIEGYQQRKISPPPKVGEHTEEILTELLGYSKEKIQQLRDADIV